MFHRLQSSITLIARAEAELGPLTDGQCRDLLLDNFFDLDASQAFNIVQHIRHPQAKPDGLTWDQWEGRTF